MITNEQVYLQYQAKVRAYVRSKIQDPHDAEDLVSAVFIKVIRNLDSYDPTKASLSTWVYTITRNTVTDHLRTQRSTTVLDDCMLDERSYSSLTNDTLDILADALLSLKEKERDLIALHYYMGYPLKTVAETMGMSYINAKLVHKKALANLRTYYEGK